MGLDKYSISYVLVMLGFLLHLITCGSALTDSDIYIFLPSHRNSQPVTGDDKIIFAVNVPEYDENYDRESWFILPGLTSGGTGPHITHTLKPNEVEVTYKVRVTRKSRKANDFSQTVSAKKTVIISAKKPALTISASPNCDKIDMKCTKGKGDSIASHFMIKKVNDKFQPLGGSSGNVSVSGDKLSGGRYECYAATNSSGRGLSESSDPVTLSCISNSGGNTNDADVAITLCLLTSFFKLVKW